MRRWACACFFVLAACQRARGQRVPAVTSVASELPVAPTASVSAVATEEPVDDEPPPPPGRMLGPYASVADACKSLDASCVPSGCTCEIIHPSWSAPKPARAAVDVLLLQDDEGDTHAAPAMKTATGWWVADETPEIPGGVEGGMESICTRWFARATVTPSRWKGHAGFYFRIFEEHACHKKWTGVSEGPPTFPASKDLACVDDPTGAPRCAMADPVGAKVADSFTDATLP